MEDKRRQQLCASWVFAPLWRRPSPESPPDDELQASQLTEVPKGWQWRQVTVCCWLCPYMVTIFVYLLKVFQQEINTGQCGQVEEEGERTDSTAGQIPASRLPDAWLSRTDLLWAAMLLQYVYMMLKPKDRPSNPQNNDILVLFQGIFIRLKWENTQS